MTPSEPAAKMLTIEPANVVKPGYLTTEFYVTLLNGLAPLLAVLFHRDVTSSFQTWAVIAAGLATVAYNASRAFVKHSTIKSIGTSVGSLS